MLMIHSVDEYVFIVWIVYLLVNGATI